MNQPLSSTEENYLKAIFKLCEQSDKPASTNDVALALNTRAASVTDMLKRLAEKSLINYVKYFNNHLECCMYIYKGCLH